MSDFVFNKSKGKIRYYAEQVGTSNQAFVMLLCKSAGLEADATLRDYLDIATLLAGTTDECTFTNYARKTITAVTVTQDNANDWVTITTANLVWTAAGGASNNSIGAAILAFDNDTTTGTDANLVPVAKWDYSATTDGTDLTLTVNAAGLLRAA